MLRGTNGKPVGIHDNFKTAVPNQAGVGVVFKSPGGYPASGLDGEEGKEPAAIPTRKYFVIRTVAIWKRNPELVLIPGFVILMIRNLTRKLAIDESARVSAYVKSELAFPKVNFAAIGNVVPQLHLHIIGRKPGDTCWPSPVWGHLEDSVSYEANRRVSMATDLVQRYGMHGAEELA